MFDLNKKRIQERITALLSNKNLIPNDCSRLIIDLRELTESRGGSSSFPMINFYGNWSVHFELDRKPIPEILKKIEEQFSIPEDRQSTSDFIADLFSVKRFQEEVFSFDSEIPKLAIFRDKKLWIEFLGCFLGTLLDKPLLHKDQVSQIDNMFLKIVPDSSGFLRLSWVIKTRKGVNIVCPFCLDYPVA